MKNKIEPAKLAKHTENTENKKKLVFLGALYWRALVANFISIASGIALIYASFAGQKPSLAVKHSLFAVKKSYSAVIASLYADKLY